jgi:hypothetical protein
MDLGLPEGLMYMGARVVGRREEAVGLGQDFVKCCSISLGFLGCLVDPFEALLTMDTITYLVQSTPFFHPPPLLLSTVFSICPHFFLYHCSPSCHCFFYHGATLIAFFSFPFFVSFFCFMASLLVFWAAH